jgi:hypothetical protein
MNIFNSEQSKALTSALNSDVKTSEKIYRTLKESGVLIKELNRISRLDQESQGAEITALNKAIFLELFETEKTSFTAYKLGGVVDTAKFKQYLIHFTKDWYQLKDITPANFFSMVGIDPLKGQSKHDPRAVKIRSTVNEIFLGLNPKKAMKKSNCQKLLDLLKKANGMEVLDAEMPAIRKAVDDLLASLAIIKNV